MSESSETSIGAESLTEMEVEMPRKRLGSVPNRDELAKDAGTMNNYLYDKYLAKWVNTFYRNDFKVGPKLLAKLQCQT